MFGQFVIILVCSEMFGTVLGDCLELIAVVLGTTGHFKVVGK